MPIAVVAVALTTGLVAATFVKAFGIGFLAQPRSTEAAGSHESPPSMLAGMVMLVTACIALGVGAHVLRTPLAHVTRTLGLGTAVPIVGPVVGGSFSLGSGRATLVPIVIGLTLIAVVAFLAAVRRVAGGRPRVTEAWGCGRTHATARMEYTATSFAEPLQRVFDDVLRPDTDLDVTHKAESAYFVESVRFRSGISDAIELRVYRPIIATARTWGRAARVIQSGSVHRYLTYAFIALIIVLVVSR
jgi:NADH:ubiquinone oxidoreductase subunit 5 (subunit L)/multisubunit Na+/H+ antiporter MnhA subunit